MERSVVQISRHLDRIGSAPNAQNTASLLMCAFCRALRRHAAKLHRIELVGDLSELAEPLPAGRSYSSKEDLRLDAEKAARRLSQRGRTMLELRQFGFEWKEIAEILHTTRCAARAEFSREVKRVRLSANKNCPD
jgi:DNA-directed RNA polymerase specialized sigma24 family protein